MWQRAHDGGAASGVERGGQQMGDQIVENTHTPFATSAAAVLPIEDLGLAR